MMCSEHLLIMIELLAHGSQGQLKEKASSIVHPSFICNFQNLLWNRLANHSQTSCGAFMGRQNENLYEGSRSHDQDGRHAFI